MVLGMETKSFVWVVWIQVWNLSKMYGYMFGWYQVWNLSKMCGYMFGLYGFKYGICLRIQVWNLSKMYGYMFGLYEFL